MCIHVKEVLLNNAIIKWLMYLKVYFIQEVRLLSLIAVNQQLFTNNYKQSIIVAARDFKSGSLPYGYFCQHRDINIIKSYLVS